MNAVNRQVSLVGFVAYDCKHGMGQIDRQTSHTASCQSHDSASRTTAQIGRDPVPQLSRMDVAQHDLFVKVEQSIMRKIVVVIICNMIGMNVVPQAATNSGR